jgi:hypothetical protein
VAPLVAARHGDAAQVALAGVPDLVGARRAQPRFSLLVIMDKEDKQNISEISDQIQKKFIFFSKKL